MIRRFLIIGWLTHDSEKNQEDLEPDRSGFKSKPFTDDSTAYE